MASKLYIGNSVLVDLSNYYNKSEVDSAISNVDVSDQLSNYVEKDGSKVLSDNNFTDALKTKLEGLSNFDPTNINSAISAIQSTLGDITGDGAAVTAALDTWNEIKAFVADYTNTGDLQDLINTTTSNIQTWVGNQGFLTSTAAASTYQPKISGTPIVETVFHDENEQNAPDVPSITDLNPGCGNTAGEYSNLCGAVNAGAANYNEGGNFVFKCGLYTLDNTNDGWDNFGTSYNLLFAVGNGMHKESMRKAYNYVDDSLTDEQHDAFEVRQDGTVYVVDTSSNLPYYQKPMLNLQTELAKATNSIQNTGGVTAIVKLTQSAFNALASKDSGTLYIVEDDPVQAGS